MEIFDNLVQLQWQEISCYSEQANNYLAKYEQIKRIYNDDAKNNKETITKLQSERDEDLVNILTLREQNKQLEEKVNDGDKNSELDEYED